MKARVLHYTYIRYSKLDLDTYANDYIWILFCLCIHIVTCVFILEIVRVLLDFTLPLGSAKCFEILT